MPNPNIPQGNLNRLVASVTWANFSSLNVTPSYLGRAGISFSREGVATGFIGTMTGTVISNEPYQMITLTLNLLKTQSLAVSYDNQRKTQSNIGNGTVRPDVSSGIGPIDIVNCGIETVRELSFSGEDAGYVVVIRGYEPVNSALWP